VVADEVGLSEQTFLAELYLDTLVENEDLTLKLKTISRNPAVRRDIALLIEKTVPFASIEAQIRDAAGEVLEKQWLFDVYDGKGIPEGKHSLGIGLQFRKLGSNFTDEEANQVRDSIVSALATLGGSIR
jgi:phenylalanyl-tRNA synthetase beta chain